MGSGFYYMFGHVSPGEAAYRLFENLQYDRKYAVAGKDPSIFLNDKKLWEYVEREHEQNCSIFRAALEEMGVYPDYITHEQIQQLMAKDGLWEVVEEQCQQIEYLKDDLRELSNKLETLESKQSQNDDQSSNQLPKTSNVDLSHEKTDKIDPESTEAVTREMQKCLLELREGKKELESVLPAVQVLCTFILKYDAFKKYGAPNFDYSILKLRVEEQDSDREEVGKEDNIKEKHDKGDSGKGSQPYSPQSHPSNVPDSSPASSTCVV